MQRGDKVQEIFTRDEETEWHSSRKRIGFLGSSDTVELQNDIWIMELFQKEDGGYSILITLQDESLLACDFDDVS